MLSRPIGPESGPDGDPDGSRAWFSPVPLYGRLNIPDIQILAESLQQSSQKY